MSVVTIMIATVGAAGMAAAVATLIDATRILQRRARRVARATGRVAHINVTFDNDRTSEVPLTPAAVQAVKKALDSEARATDRTKTTATRPREHRKTSARS